MIPAVFRGLCPGGGDLVTHRGGCPEGPKSELWRVRRDLDEYERLFEACVGSRPWAVQRAWAARVLLGESFAMLAPTGVGKTSFGVVTSVFVASRGGRSYVVVPTALLVAEVSRRVVECASRAAASGILGEVPRVVRYLSRAPASEREAALEAARSGDFDVLVTTAQFLARRGEVLEGLEFSLIFVDDVDSLLRSSGSVDRILGLLGFGPREVERALSDPLYSPGRPPRGVLVVSTATGRPGPRAILFRRLLGFEVSPLRGAALRNVVDVAAGSRDPGILRRVLGEMGPGALILLADSGLAGEALSAAEEAGLRAEVVFGSAAAEGAVGRFASGELDALIGAARPYGVLVRGVDLPGRVRYAAFLGTPRFEVSLPDVPGLGPRALASLLGFLSPVLGPEALTLARRIRSGRFGPATLEEARSEVSRVLSDPGTLRAAPLGAAVEEAEGGGVRLAIPDLRTYLQGSGRTSRLTPGGLTRGASFLIDGGPLADALIRRASAAGLEFLPLDEVDLTSLAREIDEDRRRIREAASSGRAADLLRTALMVVESPNKARTIARFFGVPGRRVVGGIPAYEVCAGNLLLTVAASGGHVVDLTTEGGFRGVLWADELVVPGFVPLRRCRSCGHRFTDLDRCPRCGSADLALSSETVEALRRLALGSDLLVVATDPDTEGEKIAWDLTLLLSGHARSTVRAEFHEVTRRAVEGALASPGTVDEDRVRAQILRRVEDRWIGFELSREVQEAFGDRNLSAGRAQTPVLGWIIERYLENRRKRDVTVVEAPGLRVRLEGRVGEPGRARAVLSRLGSRVEEVPPPPPMSTDEMLGEAGRILGMGAGETMDAAQALFEAGLITYHRTDSVRVSDAGLRVAREYLGDEFRPRRWGEGGAHECVRPTKPLSPPELTRYLREGLIRAEGIGRRHLRLYRLIFGRFMASQSPPAVVRREEYELSLAGRSARFERVTEILEPGWTRHHRAIRAGPALSPGELEVEVRHLRVPGAPLYTQADVVRLMRERGIGRPSTYAAIIDRLLSRGYVIERGGRLIPTRRGVEVHRYLSDRYPNLVGEERTADREERMRAVEEGRADYQEELARVYGEVVGRGGPRG